MLFGFKRTITTQENESKPGLNALLVTVWKENNLVNFCDVNSLAR